MDTVVAIFSDEALAAHAADALLKAGMPTSSVHLHERGRPPRNAQGIVADEYMTGGFLANFVGLLDDLLETNRHPDSARSYADAVQHESVVLSVQAVDEQVALVEELLRKEGASKMSRPSQGDTPLRMKFGR